MNALLLWFHRTGSPPNFDRFCARWTPWCFAAAVALLLPGLYGALFSVPTDYKQGDSFRILYIHVPAAWMSLLVYACAKPWDHVAIQEMFTACK
jgi:heme exporter protein C